MPVETPADPNVEMDLSGLEQLAGDDRHLIDHLLADLVASNAEDRVRLQALHADSDRIGLRDLAHRIKGGARMIKAQRLILWCEQLETACSEYDSHSLNLAVQGLHDAMQRLDRYLKR